MLEKRRADYLSRAKCPGCALGLLGPLHSHHRPFFGRFTYFEWIRYSGEDPALFTVFDVDRPNAAFVSVQVVSEFAFLVASAGKTASRSRRQEKGRTPFERSPFGAGNWHPTALGRLE